MSKPQRCQQSQDVVGIAAGLVGQRCEIEAADGATLPLGLRAVVLEVNGPAIRLATDYGLSGTWVEAGRIKGLRAVREPVLAA